MASKLIRVTLLVVLAAALLAPLASAKRYDPPGTFPAQSSALTASTSAVYAIGCKNGTIPGTTGGDNMNYDYYGNPCNAPVPANAVIGSVAPVVTPVTAPAACADHADYDDYYQGPCSY